VQGEEEKREKGHEEEEERNDHKELCQRTFYLSPPPWARPHPHQSVCASASL
tara:strand:- start:140 stop:295 length:156 start_codon:yes stop_codon:yes gene_type:complete